MTPEERRRQIAETIGTAAEDFTPAALHALANGAIMDPNRLFLPAGRFSPEETRARELRILRGEAG
ncbi:hypothetical protein [Sphingomonas sp. NFR15]|uniref:hypothetical protein n=1 Tax=Sphingomonas sp. NFR15 TaxID=1566282 RepID=UPI00088EC9A8|nr:hypothetical protein [Sphingomonas sp. NFR15]SDA15066.1 hypothetical protein SAMN03159340_00635 [Sphingomonas sp. NFR15]